MRGLAPVLALLALLCAYVTWGDRWETHGIKPGPFGYLARAMRLDEVRKEAKKEIEIAGYSFTAGEVVTSVIGLACLVCAIIPLLPKRTGPPKYWRR